MTKLTNNTVGVYFEWLRLQGGMTEMAEADLDERVKRSLAKYPNSNEYDLYDKFSAPS